jgi:nucleotide-binding universal stress UspA family protein
MFHRLLLAIDDSPSSEVAVDFATAVARKCAASVHVLYVNEYVVASRGVTLLTRPEAVALVSGAVEQLRGAGIVVTGSSSAASYRHVARRIAEEARERSADVIVLGSNRRHRFSRLFSTNVRERTVRLTELPVLTAPSPLEVRTRQLRGELMPLLREVERALP